MVYYADYEALEFDNVEAEKEGIYPYYLDINFCESSLCPIFFSACNKNGDIVCRQNAYQKRISFLDFLDNEIEKHSGKQNIIFVWFHNIKYDFRIILHELFYNNFKNILDSESLKYIGEYETEQDNSFAIVGENLSKYIGINLYYRGFKILIRDTMSIINSAQDKILKDFGYEPKVDVNWEKINIKNLRQNIKLIEDRNIYDVVSLSKCIEQFKNVFYEKFNGKGSTAASMSLDAFKYYLCKSNGISSIDKDIKEDFFREIYPKLSKEMIEISSGTYNGGICTINKNHSNKILNKLQMIDINSSYPYSMTLALPYGNGTEIKDFCTDGYCEYIVFVKFEFSGIPFQRCHSENKARSILGIELTEKIYTRSQFPDKFEGYLCINSIDLNTLKKYANVTELKFEKGIKYKTNFILKEFIEPIYNERKKSTGVNKLAIKLLLNSLYGKYAQDLSGIVFLYQSIDKYEKIIAIDDDSIYKPLASAVTAYSRKNLIDTIYLIGDDFIYCDTDSIYFKNVNKCMDIFDKHNIIHDNNLGKWATDAEYGDYITKGKFLSKKNYLIEINGKNKLTCVGLSNKYHDQINFNNFEIDSEPFETYKMVNIYGGKAMRKAPFRIKERIGGMF